jgi:outer membrane immunogenic protein
MKKFLLAYVASAALVAGPAVAADMAVKVPVYKPPFSWSSCYGGISAGYFGALDRYDNAPSGALLTALTAAQIAAGQTSYSSTGSSAYVYGAQLGCNYQWSSVVLGVEGDFNGTGLDEQIITIVPASATWLGKNETDEKKLNWFSTFRARFGVTPVDGWLFYATGGVAVAHFSSSYFSLFTDGTTYAGSASTTRTGWTAGGGVEWNVATNWSLKLEYLYLDFGSFGFASPNTSVSGAAAAPAFTWTTNVRAREQLVRVGVNYMFGGPVVAKY